MDNCRQKSLDMPRWLLKDEKYIAQSDRDTFVNKSILSILGTLSRIKVQDSNQLGKAKVNAVFKVAFTLVLVLLISMSSKCAFVAVINVYLLVILSTMEAKIIVKVLRVSLIMALFTFIILLPAALLGNSYSSIMIPFKVFATITSVNILSRSTKWNAITSALKRFFVPDIFILVFDITIKYIVMLGDLAVNMLYALRLRSVGRNKGKYTALSGIAGTMFIKSKEMAEDTYDAMMCRGFTGEYHVRGKITFTFYDFAYIMVNIVLIVTFFYFERS